jgi:hypothetical protein
MAQYYGRLLRWLMNGTFVDENGATHTGGPGWWNMTYWEVFNEGEHGYNASWCAALLNAFATRSPLIASAAARCELVTHGLTLRALPTRRYTHDYDVVVNEIRRAADPEHRLKFVGIGGADISWIPYFLNRSNHMDPTIPLDFVSIHFYASCASRTDPTTYPLGFFGDADGFVQTMENVVLPWRQALSPDTKLDLDELGEGRRSAAALANSDLLIATARMWAGVILPDDNDPSFNITADIPDLYWNAAGAMYAYLFGRLSALGVEVTPARSHAPPRVAQAVRPPAPVGARSLSAGGLAQDPRVGHSAAAVPVGVAS